MSRLSGKGAEGKERQLPSGAKAEAEEAFVEAIAAAFRGWNYGGTGQGELERSSSDPELYFYDRGMTVMLVRAHSNIYQANTKFDRLNMGAMRKRTNMLVIDWRRGLYFW